MLNVQPGKSISSEEVQEATSSTAETAVSESKGKEAESQKLLHQQKKLLSENQGGKRPKTKSKTKQCG